MGSFEADFKKSENAFLNIVWPKLKELWFSDYELEATNRLFDVHGGIDCVLRNGNGLLTLATRNQWSIKSWDSFTIRSERHTGAITEFQKRLRNISSNSLYPKFTCQAYIQNNTGLLLSIGLILTGTLFEAASQLPPITRTNSEDNNKFRVIWWSDLIREGYDVRIWKNN